MFGRSRGHQRQHLIRTSARDDLAQVGAHLRTPLVARYVQSDIQRRCAAARKNRIARPRVLSAGDVMHACMPSWFHECESIPPSALDDTRGLRFFRAYACARGCSLPPFIQEAKIIVQEATDEVFEGSRPVDEHTFIVTYTAMLIGIAFGPLRFDEERELVSHCTEGSLRQAEYYSGNKPPPQVPLSYKTPKVERMRIARRQLEGAVRQGLRDGRQMQSE